MHTLSHLSWALSNEQFQFFVLYRPISSNQGRFATKLDQIEVLHQRAFHLLYAHPRTFSSMVGVVPWTFSPPSYFVPQDPTNASHQPTRLKCYAIKRSINSWLIHLHFYSSWASSHEKCRFHLISSLSVQRRRRCNQHGSVRGATWTNYSLTYNPSWALCHEQFHFHLSSSHHIQPRCSCNQSGPGRATTQTNDPFVQCSFTNFISVVGIVPCTIPLSSCIVTSIQPILSCIQPGPGYFATRTSDS